MTQNIIENALTNSASGATEKFVISNDSNTASSAAECAIVQAGSSGDDVWTEYVVGTTRSYALGINESNSNALEFTIGTSSTNPSSGNSVLLYRANSETLNKTDQPCFLAYKSSNSTNAVGNGTPFVIDASTIRYDIGSDYNTGTYTFTAPVTGKYLIFAAVQVSNLGGTMSYFNLQMATSNLNYVSQKQYITGSGTVDGLCNMAYVDMDAADTFIVATNVYNGTQTATVNGNSTITTFIGGALIA